MKDGGDNSGAARRRRPASTQTAGATVSSSTVVLQAAPSPTSQGEAGGREAAPCEELFASYIHSHVADEMAHLALAQRTEAAQRSCDLCEQPIEGEPAGRGLFFWSRDGEPRWDEPILCDECAGSIHATATRCFESDDEEEG